MKRKQILILTPVAIGVIVLILALSGAFGGSDEPDDAAPAEIEEAAQPVRVATVEEMTLRRTVSYSGTIEAWEQALITAPSGARIERIHVREGNFVRQGQIVVNMENANLQQAQVQLEQARNDMERMRRLVEVGSVSRQQLEQAEVQFENARSTVESLQQNTVLRSPINGVVTARHFVDGEMFMPGAQTPSILTVMQTNPLKVIVNVSENYFPYVEEGMAAAVRLDMYPGRTFDATVAQIYPTVDPSSRTFRVELRVDNPGDALSPGMFARVELDLGEITGLFLPAATIQQSPGSNETFVFKLEGTTARRTVVATGPRMEEYRLIEGGLGENDIVVTEGVGRLHEGAEVRVVH